MKIYAPALCWICTLVLSAATGAFAADCGTETPCTISDDNGGTYYYSVPLQTDPNSPFPAFVFFHGHNGSGRGVIRNKSLVQQLHRAGFAVVAPDGPIFTFRGRTAQGWAARRESGTARGGRDDIAFVENVLADLGKMIRLDHQKTVVSGFSSGGSMAWYFSCYSKTPLAGVVAVAGGLRRPLPSGGIRQSDGSIANTCPGGPRRLIHIHGFSDRQVPLERRGIRAWHQGDVFEGLAVQRHTNQCNSRPDKISTKSAFWCRDWNKCDGGLPVRFCLHAGGHGMPKGWLSTGLDWLSQTK